MIRDIRGRWHEGVLREKGGCGDVLLVAHGHILRAFAMRWIGRELTEGVGLILEGMCVRVPTFSIRTLFWGGGMVYANRVCCCRVAGGVGTLSYEHHSVNEPAIL